MSLVLLGVLSSRSVFAVSTPPTWKAPETPLSFFNASYDNQRGDRFLAYDHYGVPSAVTVDTNGNVEFARQLDGTNWSSRALPGTNAKHASLAFDRRELPAVVYGDAFGLNYNYFSPISQTFINNLVDETTVSGRNWSLGTSIAFDVYGYPAIMAATDDGSSSGLYYFSDSDQDGSISSADTIDILEELPESFPSLAFDRQNRPITANRFLENGTQGDLDVWMRDPFLGWSLTFLDNAEMGTPDAVNGSIAIDPIDGQPAMTWTNWTGSISQLWYGKWNQLENQWDTTLVTGDAVNQMGNESLAFDPGDGLPAISYGDNSGDVKFAWFDGADWNTQVAQSTSTAFAPRTSLAFNEYGHGFPAIAYITNEGLGSGPLYFIVDPPATIPEPCSLLLLCVGGAATLWLGRRYSRDGR